MLSYFTKWPLPALTALALGTLPASAQETWESVLAHVRQQCAQEWSSDYSMQAYCIREQKKGWDELHVNDPPPAPLIPKVRPGYRPPSAIAAQTVDDSNLPYEAALLNAVRDYRSAYSSATNRMVQGGLRPERGQSICQGVPTSNVKQWQGRVSRLGSNADGNGVVEIDLGGGVTVKTMNNSFSDIGANTLIPHGSALYGNVSRLSVGQMIEFDGTLFSDPVDCFRELSLTVNGAMDAPEFLIRLIDVRTERRPVSPAAVESEAATPKPPALIMTANTMPSPAGNVTLPDVTPKSATLANGNTDLFRAPVLSPRDVPTQSPPPAPVLRWTGREASVASYIQNYFGEASGTASDVSPLEKYYADTINFYGASTSRAKVITEKRKFSERWPIRQYSVNVATFTIQCTSVCTATGVVEWDAKSPERGVHSVGTANIAFQITGSGTLTILSENGFVINRSSEKTTLSRAPTALESAPASTASVSQAFADGHSARVQYEDWYSKLSDGPFRDGATFWAGNRSSNPPPSCARAAPNTDWLAGCTAAYEHLGPIDARRRNEPDFKVGWNSL